MILIISLEVLSDNYSLLIYKQTIFNTKHSSFTSVNDPALLSLDIVLALANLTSCVAPLPITPRGMHTLQ